MNYYLIANNKSISKETLENMTKDKNSCLVLYNFLYPLNIYPKLIDHKNIIYISRQVSSFMDNYKKNIQNIFPYAGMDLAKKYEKHFKKIIFHSYPKFLSEPRKTLYQNFIDKMNFNQHKIGMMEPYSFNIRNIINYPLGKNMSTGIISYTYFKNITTTHDTITIVGFNSKVSKKHHNHDFEKKFFLSETMNKKCKAI
jgi:hypothetical protein